MTTISTKFRVPLFVFCIGLFACSQLFIMFRLYGTHEPNVDGSFEIKSNLRGVKEEIQNSNESNHDGIIYSTPATTSPTSHSPNELPFKSDSSNSEQPSRNTKRTKSQFIPKPEVGLDKIQISRLEAIRNAMKHAWSGYESHAFGADEVGPISGIRKQNVWGDLGVTLVDALDTLYVMGMKDEFKRARDWIKEGLDFEHLGKNGDNISVFEITIRELGGLLSAFDLSRDEVFKKRATELGDLLLPAFDKGVFYTQYNVHKKTKSMNSWTNFRGLLADLGTLQLELRYLSDITGNPIYAEKGDAFYKIVQREGSYHNSGLFPVHYDPDTGHFSESSSIITIGALGDSFYEYLLKVWLYSGQRKEDAFLRDMYHAAVDGLEEKLLTYSEPDDAYYLQELVLPHMSGHPQQDHLLCFVPGMLALGTLTDPDPARVVKHLNMAKKLMKTCYSFYSRQPTGLAPDIVHFPGYVVKDSRYKLRPETIESLMYLFRVTKDPIYREWGWEIFQAIEKNAKTEFGYGAVINVDSLETFSLCFVGLQVYILYQMKLIPSAGDPFRSKHLHRGALRVPGNIVGDTIQFEKDPNDIILVPNIPRQNEIRNAMHHAWSSYEKYAFGADEIAPLSGVPQKDVWGGLGVTLVDALDTLYIMGMHDEFQRARDWVETKLDFVHLGKNGDAISVFEIIIRELGGLLSAYDLSRDEIFKNRAIELADLLLPAYEDQVFYTKFNVFTKRKSMNQWTGFRAFLADVGTLQLEMRYLSDITSNPEYAIMGDAFYDVIQREGSFDSTGLFPVHFDPDSGTFSRSDTFVTMGALGDSFYEYLLKVWIYSGKRKEDAFLRKAYDDAIEGMEKYLLQYSEVDDIYYLQELRIPEMKGNAQQDHLLCFVPGMLALGTMGERDESKIEKHLDLAKKLMQTCYSFYSRQPSGLGPDLVTFPGFGILNSKYKLRPETIESLMYMYRITKDPIYREWGWNMFQSIEKYAKTNYGYGTVHNVDSLENLFIEDKMESFFLAETLKYHYMLQSGASLLPLDRYVFNTEAHPLSIIKS